MVGLVRSLHTDASTSFVVGKVGTTGEIMILWGVKQGDPLSPVLFNIAMDPLIKSLDSSGYGYRAGPLARRVKLSALADDLAALTSTKREKQKQLGIVEVFCKTTGMKVNVGKCAAFWIQKSGKSFTVNEGVNWSIGDQALPLLEPGQSTKYLGHVSIHGGA